MSDTPIPPGTVLVADEVIAGGRHRCPAAPLIEGTLARAGVPTCRGAVPAPGTPEVVADWVRLGEHALGVATRDHDRRARQAARAAITGWLAAAGARRVLVGALSREAELALVGDAELLEAARVEGVRAYRIDAVGDIRARWLLGVRTVAVVGPAADRVIESLSGLGTVAAAWLEGVRADR